MDSSSTQIVGINDINNMISSSLGVKDTTVSNQSMKNETINYNIIMVESVQEAEFANKFMTNIITVGFNKDYTAFAIDTKTIFVYPNKLLSTVAIFSDASIMKLISKPIAALRIFLHGERCENYQHISNYLKCNLRDIFNMKQEIMDQGNVISLSNRAANVALIMMKYKIIEDNRNKSLQINKSLFNNKRDCYLLYLTAFNDILSHYGPLKYTDLTKRIKLYPYLCRVKLHPAMALEGLISVGALSNDSKTSIISIPDQIP